MALNDGRCERCGKRYGWSGRLTDMPPCPKCGWEPDPEDLERDQAEMDRVMREMFGDDTEDEGDGRG